MSDFSYPRPQTCSGTSALPGDPYIFWCVTPVGLVWTFKTTTAQCVSFCKEHEVEFKPLGPHMFKDPLYKHTDIHTLSTLCSVYSRQTNQVCFAIKVSEERQITEHVKT